MKAGFERPSFKEGKGRKRASRAPNFTLKEIVQKQGLRSITLISCPIHQTGIELQLIQIKHYFFGKIWVLLPLEGALHLPLLLGGLFNLVGDPGQKLLKVGQELGLILTELGPQAAYLPWAGGDRDRGEGCSPAPCPHLFSCMTYDLAGAARLKLCSHFTRHWEGSGGDKEWKLRHILQVKSCTTLLELVPTAAGHVWTSSRFMAVFSFLYFYTLEFLKWTLVRCSCEMHILNLYIRRCFGDTCE